VNVSQLALSIDVMTFYGNITKSHLTPMSENVLSHHSHVTNTGEYIKGRGNWQRILIRLWNLKAFTALDISAFATKHLKMHKSLQVSKPHEPDLDGQNHKFK